MKKNRIMSGIIIIIFALVMLTSNISIALPVIPSINNTPASFSNTSYEVKDNVFLLNDNLNTILSKAKISEEIITNQSYEGYSSTEKLDMTAFVEKNVFTSHVGSYEKGMIIFDEKNKIAVKVTEDVGFEQNPYEPYVALEKPQVHEVLSDFEIPEQTITLNMANISGFSQGVEACIIDENNQKKTYSNNPTTYASNSKYPLETYTNTDYKEKTLSYSLSDPLVEMEFNNTQLAAYDSNGEKVNIVASGYIGVDKIRVTGKYSFMGGYKFVAKTGEKIDLKVTSSMNMKKELVIPLFGIDVPAGIADVRGGLFLVVGIDGNFQLITEAKQWLEVEAGLRGGTFLGAPTSFKPVLGHSKGFEADANFLGAVNGYIKAGPLLNLELLGWDIAGAGALVGTGVNCNVEGVMIHADIYGTLEVYASLIGKRINIVNNKMTLFQIQKYNTQGFDIRFNEVCAFRRSMWGNILRDEGQGPKPFTGSIDIRVDKSNGEQRLHTVQCQNGSFILENLTYQLNKNDKIKVIRADGIDIPQHPVSPTFPFKHVELEYADFFNDHSKGLVSPALVKNWEVGGYDEITYDGDVEINIDDNGNIINLGTTKANQEGNFEISYDFKPHHKAGAAIVFNGFRIDTKEKIKTDTDIIGNRLIEKINESTYEENGRNIERRLELEHFIILNLRGEKSVNQEGNYRGEYYHYHALSHAFDPYTGLVLNPPTPLGNRSFSKMFNPCGPGGSSASKFFITEWAWAKPIDMNIINPDIMIPLKDTNDELNIEPWSNEFESVKSEEQNDSSITNKTLVIDELITEEEKQKVYELRELTLPDRIVEVSPGVEIGMDAINFRYESGLEEPDEKVYLGDVPDTGIDSLKKKGVVTIEYEGVPIEIRDPADEDKRPGGRKKPLHQVDPFTDIMIKYFWSRVNPSPIESISVSPVIRNMTAIPDWSRNSAINLVGNGVMNLKMDGSFKMNDSVSRGECASYLARVFDVSPQLKTGKFNDIPSMYPYEYEIHAAYENGLVAGTGENTFHPFNNVTREQAAAIITRGLKNFYGDKVYISKEDAILFTDKNEISGWALESVEEISATGLMIGYPEGDFRPQKNITFNEMAVLLNKLETYIQRYK